MKKLLFISVFTLLLYSCKKEEPKPDAPTVDFTYSGAYTFAPAQVTFTSNVTGGDTYHWDFGDNATSTDANPTHTYTDGGVYTVTLKVTGEGGTTQAQKTINIDDKPTQAIITRITLNNMININPTTGQPWDDDGTGPDVFCFIVDSNNSNNIYYTGSLIQDVTQMPLVWTSNGNPTIPADRQLTIAFVDGDGQNNVEIIGYQTFDLRDYMTVQNHYPSSIHLTNQNIDFTLEITW